jgi:DNA-binding transcriptional ArsR family regulator
VSDENNILPSPNRLVHEPARLAILTVLSSCASADFVFLLGVTGLSKGNLSVQLTNLEEAGLVTIEKEIVDKKMRTTVRLSKRGVTEIDQYWKTMDEIRARMERQKGRRQAAAGRTRPRTPGLSPELAR